MKILLTGATGLVGSKFLETFKDKYEIVTIGRSNVDIELDLTSEEQVSKVIEEESADAVINFAAFTNVDGAEAEKGDRSGEVYKLNALLPAWLANSCKKTGKDFYHISTDYVFNGESDRPYTEEDLPSPVDSWYSISKFDGEENVKKAYESKEEFTIVRISFPYSGTYRRKLDFVRVIIDKLSKKEAYYGISDQKIKPTSVDDIASALDFLLTNKVKGIYHVVGKYPDGFISPYDFALKVAQLMNLDSSLIKPILFDELSQKRIAPRPKNTWLDTKKIESLGFEITDIDKALERFKEQY